MNRDGYQVVLNVREVDAILKAVKYYRGNAGAVNTNARDTAAVIRKLGALEIPGVGRLPQPDSARRD